MKTENDGTRAVAGWGLARDTYIACWAFGEPSAVNELQQYWIVTRGNCCNTNVYLKLMSNPRMTDLFKVDASPVHLANGIWGVLAAGLFATEEGYSASYYAERSHQ